MSKKFLAALVVAAAVAAIVGVSTASARGAAAFSLPPNGVYTCDWIAAHPAAAAQARVTCDPSIFFAAMSSPVGALAATAGPTTPDSPDANGCQPVPNDGGRVSPGVFAWSTYEYSNEWAFYANYGPPVYYTFYIQKTDGTNVLSGPITDNTTHSFRLGSANIYRWGAQNHSYPTQSWWVCYYTV